jgi:uncharacterized protein (DUF169 family)
MCPGPCGLCMVKKTKVFVSPFTSNFMFEQVSCGVSMKTLITVDCFGWKDLTLLQDPEVAVGITRAATHIIAALTDRAVARAACQSAAHSFSR